MIFFYFYLVCNDGTAFICKLRQSSLQHVPNNKVSCVLFRKGYEKANSNTYSRRLQDKTIF